MKKYKPDSRNARLHDERNLEAIKASLAELGAGRSIVVDKDGVVIGGNAVYEKAVELGIPVKEIETDGSELVVVRRVDLDTDDPRRKALALADNKINELSQFDYQSVAELIKELDLDEISIKAMGFVDFEVGPLLEAEWVPPEKDTLGGKEHPPKTVICPECGHEFEI